jgi:AcrR family transcriptional regulator
MTSVWERLEQGASAARPALSAQAIATTAVGIADADGLGAITMRRLAAELGVSTMAAYRHVSGKDDVFELMVDLVYGEVDVPGEAGWRETMAALARGLRALVLKHPWLTRVPGPQEAYELTPNRMALAERALAALRGQGPDADTAMTVYRTVAAYAHGAASAETGLRQLMSDRCWNSGDEARTGLSAQMTWLLSTGRYPMFARYIHEATRKDDLDWQFETGLQYVLDGIAARTG